jgi:hypothetical protein
MAERDEGALQVWSAEDAVALRTAKLKLEHPGLAARLADLIGSPIEVVLKRLPKGWQEKGGDLTQAALMTALEVALKTLRNKPTKRSRERFHKIAVVGTGGLGGFFGLSAVAVELPVTTAVILRSIADIARSEGHDLSRLSVKLACLEVLALGGSRSKDDAAKTGYWAVRTSLARYLEQAASYVAKGGIGGAKSAPPLVRLTAAIASRFGVVVEEELAAKAIPVLSAGTGAAVNLAFMNHFQEMARGHFIVRRLEKKYGTESVRKAYDELEV